MAALPSVAVQQLATNQINKSVFIWIYLKNKYLESLLEKDKILCDVFVPVSYCRLRHFESVPHMKEFLLLNYKRLKHNQRNASNVPVKERRRRRRRMDVNNAGFQKFTHTEKKKKNSFANVLRRSKNALSMFFMFITPQGHAASSIAYKKKKK